MERTGADDDSASDRDLGALEQFEAELDEVERELDAVDRGEATTAVDTTGEPPTGDES